MKRKQLILGYAVVFLFLANIPAFANQTVLVANFLNGNNDAFNSRIYLWNPSESAGSVTARVFTLPLRSGLAQELTVAPLNLGTLAAKSALNIKLAEDILASLGITTPYITDGGNLTVEFTIGSENVQGVAQVFSSSFAFGTYPLQEISATSTGSPTVLVAEFSNGNSAVLLSRVYLFNPSTSAGNVTVRVFTLPLRSGLAQELTTTPLNLGTLGARSALNIKLAEDILALLTPLPYTADGGNLTLEFTIQAANVRGVAQVFTSTFAFGTYPLGVASSTDDAPPDDAPPDDTDPGGILPGALEVLANTVFISQSSTSFVEINGAVRNKEFQDATFVEVAIQAYDSNGKMTGGDTTFISGTPRKQGSLINNAGLLRNGIGYFDSFIRVNGTVQSAQFFVVAEERTTLSPLAQINAISSTITRGSFGDAEVSGTIRNNGTATANSIFTDVILLDSQGRVLEIDLNIPNQSTLAPGATSTFSERTSTPFSQVASVVFSFDWNE